MTRTSTTLLAIMLLMISCNNDDKDNKAKDPTSAKLEKMTALSLEELEKLRPAELMGITGTKLPSDSSLPRAIKTAYNLENGGSLILSIMDCGGVFGASMYEATYLNLLQERKDKGVEYNKTIEFKGGKAIETCFTDSGKCLLIWFAGDRFLVTVQGNNVKMDKMKEAANEVNIR